MDFWLIFLLIILVSGLIYYVHRCVISQGVDAKLERVHAAITCMNVTRYDTLNEIYLHNSAELEIIYHTLLSFREYYGTYCANPRQYFLDNHNFNLLLNDFAERAGISISNERYETVTHWIPWLTAQLSDMDET